MFHMGRFMRKDIIFVSDCNVCVLQLGISDMLVVSIWKAFCLFCRDYVCVAWFLCRGREH